MVNEQCAVGESAKSKICWGVGSGSSLQSFLPPFRCASHISMESMSQLISSLKEKNMYWVTEKAWATCKEKKVMSQEMKSAKGV